MILNMTGKGGGETVLISDTLDVNGGTIRTITAQRVVSLQTKTITPTSSVQTVNPDTGYDGFSQVTVNAGGGSATIQSLSVAPTTSEQTFNASGVDGYKPVVVAAMPAMTLPTSTAASATGGYTSKATVSRSTSDQYINIPTGYNAAGAYYKISAVANGSATAPSTISGTSATISTGTNTLTLTKTVSVTPTVSAGYVSAGTAGNASVSLTASVTTKAAATITPGTTNQTIASGTYLTGTQTIAGDVDLVASNIKKDVNIFGVTGTYEPNDFVITLTQDSNENWVPDCTYAEAYAAYQAGKNIIFSTRGTEYTLGLYSTDEGVFLYSIFEFYQNGFSDDGYTSHDYRWTSSGTESDGTSTYRDTTSTTATISDVVSGQTFFNSSGYQTGTLVVQNYYTGSSAPSSSLGNNGDLYLQS